MKTPTHQNQMVHRPFIFAALLAGIFLVPAVRAQPAVRNVDNRFLLIFDTSSNMKRRLPVVQKALNDMLATSLSGQLHAGDTIGVRTFDRDLHAGQFPLQHWEPDNGAMIASNITAFVGKQRYTKTTRFDALLPLLNQVVGGSERLTVLIFCDGKGEIHGTPYDVAINQIFQQRQGERQKARLPIVIGLRSQRGQYTGCTVSFPPLPVSLPAFPPLPEAVHAPPKVTNAPAPPSPPRSSVPPLIIIGTPPTNRVPPALKPALTNPPPMVITSTPAPVVANEVKAPVVVPLMQTSAVPAQPKIAAVPLTTTNAIAPPPMVITSTSAPVVANEVKPPAVVPLMQTSAVPAQPKIVTVPLTTTNAIAPPPESSKTGHKVALAVGAAFLAAAGGLAVFMLRRSRKADHASLITRAMNEDKDEDKDTGKHEEKHEEKREDKKEGKKFPTPMT
jgi:hypothetical protein